MTSPASALHDSSPPQLSLRERKFARTKLALLQTAIEKLRDKPLSDITVKELCEEVQICEATFFNYFPKKDDLLHYFIRIWTLEVTLDARNAVGEGAGLAFVEHVFHSTGRELAEHPRIMQEIIGHMALDPHQASCDGGGELTLAECRQAFPDVKCVKSLPDVHLEHVFRPALERAIELGELPAGADLDAAVLGLISTFFGVPLWLCCNEPERIQQAYHDQLALLWAGLGARRSAQ